MVEKEFKVLNKLGLHARPAAMFVQATSRFKSMIKVRKGDQTVDGKSIMGLMMLAAEEGAKLLVIAEGPDEQEVLQTLEKLFSGRFDEKE